MPPLQSSALASADWDPDSGVLTVVFRNGRSYQYAGVPESVFLGLLQAPSAGQYYKSAIERTYSAL
jgi:hypothetical protein